MVTAPAVSPAAGNVVESIARTTPSAPAVTLNAMPGRAGAEEACRGACDRTLVAVGTDGSRRDGNECEKDRKHISESLHGIPLPISGSEHCRRLTCHPRRSRHP